jgi:hypothetical protein
MRKQKTQMNKFIVKVKQDFYYESRKYKRREQFNKLYFFLTIMITKAIVPTC